jgi:hypothetical protein
VSYTGTGSNGTIGHGLTSAPEVIIIKARTRNENWLVYHKFDGGTDGRSFLNLNLTVDKFDNGASGYFQGTAPTASLFYQNGSSYNQNTDTYIAYCFHSVEGYSKFGSYFGNSSGTDGPFVHTGFAPTFVLGKVTTQSGRWWIYDSARSPKMNYAIGTGAYIAANNTMANSTQVEAADNGVNAIELLSNGFKVNTTNAEWNGSTHTYVYLAFAEAPFKFANAR